MDNIPFSHQAMFLNDDHFLTDGFAMLTRLIASINPDTPENLYLAVLELVTLEQKASESGAVFLSRVKGLDSRLRNKSISDIMHLFALNQLDRDRYGGLIDCFHRGDTELFASLFHKYYLLFISLQHGPSGRIIS